jgi:hypothetical protein
MTIKDHSAEAKADLQKRIGEGLARCAIHFQTQHKIRLNKSNPGPDYLDSSTVGQYPRARTGFGRDGTSYEPTSPAAMAAAGNVRMGYISPAWYMGFLELFKGRLGLKKTLEDLKDQFVAILKNVGARK